uniref:BTB domain-containing protein n=1 Tax=Trichogramma kaykai TaxID=54128 RepID=A0ABD2X6A0_9HYME
MSSKQRIEASTTVTSDECIYTWTIKNYRSLQFDVGQLLESPKFGVGIDNKKYFKLQLYPEGDGMDDSAGHISFYLKPVIDSAKKPDKLICRVAVMIINNKKIVQKWRMCHDFATSGFLGRGWKKFFELEHIDKLISFENTVTIQCELEIFNEIESSQNSEIICRKDEAIGSMKFDFSFLSEKLSDVKLIVEEDEIPAHKIVLSAASPVFRAMFIHDMLENTENSVKITDITEDILTEMLSHGHKISHRGQKWTLSFHERGRLTPLSAQESRVASHTRRTETHTFNSEVLAASSGKRRATSKIRRASSP